MYLIRSNDSDSLKQLAESLDALDGFPHCDLGALNSLEMTELCDDAGSWMTGEPVIYDEEKGLVICAFKQSGLSWLCEHTNAIQDFDADVEALKALATTDGNLYALDTF